jgi:hypothetical protein
MKSLEKLLARNKNPSLKAQEPSPPSAHKAVFLFLVTLGLLVFGLVIDDLLIVNNRLIQSIGNFFRFFSSSSTAGAYLGNTSNFYRPLQMAAYTIIYQIFGLNSWAYHLFSISLHIVNSFLVFLLLGRFSFSRLGSFMAAALFLVHPVQAEAVSYISGLADPLAVLFLLLGLLQYQTFDRGEDNLKRGLTLGSSFVFFVLALLSKELAIVFPLLAVLLTVFSWRKYSTEERAMRLKILVGFGAVAVVYLYLRATALNFTGVIGSSRQDNVYTQNLHVRLITFVSVLWEYFKMLVAPIHLYLERPYTGFTDLFTPRGIFGLLVVAGGLIGSYFSLRKAKTFALGFLWFFTVLSLYSGVVPLNAVYLEHWLYLPLIGLGILLAALYDRLRSDAGKEVFIFIFAAIIFLLGTRTFVRNLQWVDVIKFYNNELRYNQGSARVYNNLAMGYADNGDFSSAITNYQKAIETYDIYPQTHHNLANAYLNVGRVDEGIEEYFKALELEPNFIYSHVALYKVYSALERTKKAEKFAEFAVRIQDGGTVTFEEIEEARGGP